jgi:hypothetical protein
MRSAVISVALLTACGTDAISLEDYAAASRDAFCRHAQKCGDVESVDTCHKINTGRTFALDLSLAAAVSMGKITYSGENASTCFDALADRSCDVTSESGRMDPEACRQIFVGTLPAGADCALNAECISAACDAPETCPQVRMGTCQGDTPPGHANLGESCEHAFCSAGSFCDAVEMKCLALRTSGATCQQNQCQYGLDCNQSNRCASLPQLGNSCDGPCRDEGTTCSATSQTCVKVALAGQPCTTSGDCASVYVCDRTLGRCSAGIALGAPCVAAQLCADDRASCYSPDGQAIGTCELPRANGERCGRDANCESLHCDPVALICTVPPVCT